MQMLLECFSFEASFPLPYAEIRRFLCRTTTSACCHHGDCYAISFTDIADRDAMSELPRPNYHRSDTRQRIAGLVMRYWPVSDWVSTTRMVWPVLVDKGSLGSRSYAFRGCHPCAASYPTSR